MDQNNNYNPNQNAPEQYAQPQYAQPQYAQPQYAPDQYAQGQYAPQPGYEAPVELHTNFSLVKIIFLGLITLGIYPIVIYSRISVYINRIAGPYDGRKTMHYCLVFFIFSWMTLGIVPIVWYHKLSNRIGAELRRRGIEYGFSAGTFWLWDVLASLIIVGPFVYTHKLCTAMNLLAADYNARG